MALVERRVYRSLNERFTIAGYNATEVIACYFGFYYAVAIKGFIAGFVVLVLMVAAMKYAKGRDPRFIEIIIWAKRFKRQVSGSYCHAPVWHLKQRFQAARESST
jgi:type IV secretory pathway TrbD component